MRFYELKTKPVEREQESFAIKNNPRLQAEINFGKYSTSPSTQVSLFDSRLPFAVQYGSDCLNQDIHYAVCVSFSVHAWNLYNHQSPTLHIRHMI